MSSADRMITEQIRIEFRKLNSILTDEADKPAIVQRIAELKALLDGPTPVTVQPQQPTGRELIAEFIKAIRHR